MTTRKIVVVLLLVDCGLWIVDPTSHQPPKMNFRHHRAHTSCCGFPQHASSWHLYYYVALAHLDMQQQQKSKEPSSNEDLHTMLLAFTHPFCVNKEQFNFTECSLPPPPHAPSSTCGIFLKHPAEKF